MTDAETRLAALLAADDAPVQDRVFEAQVMTRVDQRLTLLKLAQWGLYAAVGVAVVLIGLSSLIEAFGVTRLDAFAALWPIALSAAVTLACIASAWRYLKPYADWRVLISWI